MFLRRSNYYRYLKLIPLFIVLYLEFLIYAWLPLHWAEMPACETPSCIRILLVADPQLLGQQDSTWLARWDADRYLKSTFQQAYGHVQPDLIIYLGDLMDEGHVASEEQFMSDLERFVGIFAVPSSADPERIYLPGDNDIGGEEDPIHPDIVTRFNEKFDLATEPINYLRLNFYKVNKMTLTFEKPASFVPDSTRVALSHVPILRKIHTFSKNIAKSIQPHLIFSAHDHDSVHITAPLDDPWRKTIERFTEESQPWHKISISENLIHELVVPTCSYRMGTQHMAYGVAFLDERSQSVNYTLLWLPQRLLHLFLYLFFLIMAALVFCCWCLIACHRRVRVRLRRPPV